jgi:hypothetical protein
MLRVEQPGGPEPGAETESPFSRGKSRAPAGKEGPSFSLGKGCREEVLYVPYMLKIRRRKTTIFWCIQRLYSDPRTAGKS